MAITGVRGALAMAFWVGREVVDRLLAVLGS